MAQPDGPFGITRVQELAPRTSLTSAASSSSSILQSTSIATSPPSVPRLERIPSDVTLSAWLNRKLQSTEASDPTSQTPNQAPLASIKLDHASQALRQLSAQLSSVRENSREQIELLISTLVIAIPKMSVELQLMSETASVLESRITGLQISTTPTGDSADSALARIATLSKAKADMLSARHTLREAQAWSTIESEVAALLDEKRWQDAVSKLVKASESLQLFSGSTKSSDQRRALLSKLTAQIEFEAIPVLRAALVERDVAETVRMAQLFVQLRRLLEGFLPPYLKTRTEGVLANWMKRYQEEDRKPLAILLSWLHADIMALLAEERVFATKLMADTRSITILLLSHILSSLDPTLDRCISEEIDGLTSEQSLAHLTDAWKSSEEIFKSLDHLISASKSPVPNDLQEEQVVVPIDSATLSKAVAQQQPSWQELLFNPFLSYQIQFPSLEADAMLYRYENGAKVAGLTSSPYATIFRAIQVTEVALQRSADFTKTFATAPLVEHIDSLFVTSADQVRAEIENEAKRILTEVRGRIQTSNTVNGIAHTSLNYDERGEALTNADWEEFRKGTERLVTCRALLSAIYAQEQKIASQLLELFVALRPSAGATKPVEYTSSSSGLSSSPLCSDTLDLYIAKAKRFSSSQSWVPGYLSPAEVDGCLLPRSRSAVLEIGTAVQRFLHDLVLAPFMPELEAYTHLSTWTSLTRPGVSNEYDLNMPKFSLSPSDAMARIGEGMLNLPRLFEGYVEEALLFCLPKYRESLVLIDGPSQREKAAGTDSQLSGKSSDVSSPIKSAFHQQAFSATTIAPSTSVRTKTSTLISGDPRTTVPPTENEEDRDSILSLYLQSLLYIFLQHFLRSTLPKLPHLSEIGALQLATDLDYLSNISSVICSESENILRFWRKSAEIPVQIGKHLAHVLHGHSNDLPAIEGWPDSDVRNLAYSDAFITLGHLRGWL